MLYHFPFYSIIVLSIILYYVFIHKYINRQIHRYTYMYIHIYIYVYVYTCCICVNVYVYRNRMYTCLSIDSLAAILTFIIIIISNIIFCHYHEFHGLGMSVKLSCSMSRREVYV